MRLRHVATLGPRAVGLGPEAVGDTISFLPLDRIWPDDRFDPTHTVEYSGDIGSYNAVNEGDLLLPKVSPTFAHGRCAIARGLVGGRALATSEVFVLRPHDPRDARFLQYRLRSPDFLSEGQAAWAGVAGLKRVSANFVLDTRIRTDVWEARYRLSDFLDRECERIAAAEARRASLCGRADLAYAADCRRVICRDDLPWVLVKLVARPGTGHTPSRSVPEYWVPEECTIPWFSLADVWQIRDDARDVVYETAEKVSPFGIANSAAVVHPAGTVIMSRTASVGFVARMGIDMAVTQDFMTWTCGPKLLPEYLLHALRACRPEILRCVQGSTHKTIYMPDLLGIRVPLPGLAEQKEIVAKLDRVLAARRRVMAPAARLRERLTEYRDALIHEAVTGKLDVTSVSERQMEERLHAASEGRLDEVAI